MIVYYIGGPFDLTKRTVFGECPEGRLLMWTPGKTKIDGEIVAKEHYYHYLGRLHFAEDTYIYEYVPENI